MTSNRVTSPSTAIPFRGAFQAVVNRAYPPECFSRRSERIDEHHPFTRIPMSLECLIERLQREFQRFGLGGLNCHGFTMLGTRDGAAPTGAGYAGPEYDFSTAVLDHWQRPTGRCRSHAGCCGSPPVSPPHAGAVTTGDAASLCRCRVNRDEEGGYRSLADTVGVFALGLLAAHAPETERNRPRARDSWTVPFVGGPNLRHENWVAASPLVRGVPGTLRRTGGRSEPSTDRGPWAVSCHTRT